MGKRPERNSYDREENLKALHTVSAWSSEHGLVLAQEKVKSKSNEITAVPLRSAIAQPQGSNSYLGCDGNPDRNSQTNQVRGRRLCFCPQGQPRQAVLYK